MREWPLEYGIIFSRQELDVDGHMTVFTHTVPIQEDGGLFFSSTKTSTWSLIICHQLYHHHACIPGTLFIPIPHVFYAGAKQKGKL